jgi:hypothetical protein
MSLRPHCLYSLIRRSLATLLLYLVAPKPVLSLPPVSPDLASSYIVSVVIRERGRNKSAHLSNLPVMPLLVSDVPLGEARSAKPLLVNENSVSSCFENMLPFVLPPRCKPVDAFTCVAGATFGNNG